MPQARERKKSAKQQAADAALADAKREQAERRKNKKGPKRARGDDMCIKLKAPQSAMSR
jgi:hypothetical protein